MAPLVVGGSGIHSFDETHPSQMPTALEAGTLLVATLTLLAGLIASLTGCARLITPCLCIAGSIAAVCRTGDTGAQHASIGTHLLLVCVVVTI